MENVGDSVFGIDVLQNFGNVELSPHGIEDDFIYFRHLEQERFSPKPNCCKYLYIFVFVWHLSSYTCTLKEKSNFYGFVNTLHIRTPSKSITRVFLF